MLGLAEGDPLARRTHDSECAAASAPVVRIKFAQSLERHKTGFACFGVYRERALKRALNGRLLLGAGQSLTGLCPILLPTDEFQKMDVGRAGKPRVRLATGRTRPTLPIQLSRGRLLAGNLSGARAAAPCDAHYGCHTCTLTMLAILAILAPEP